MSEATGRRVLHTRHGDLVSPSFLPDGTKGVVRTLDSSDLAGCGVTAIMVNLLHLSSHPGASVISAVGGINRFMGWDGPIASDSGGFQVLSLIGQSPSMGAVSRRGLTYRLGIGQGNKKLTPEKCIRKQFQLGSDIMFCLDHCTHPKSGSDLQRESVENTIEWARRCKDEYERVLDRTALTGPRPMLFAVVQGGNDAALRRMCAERLLEIGFDGFGFGGWPIDSEGGLVEMVAYVSEIVPPQFPKHALGIGKPENVVKAYQAGYDLFDCAIPTRDARRRRLYGFVNGTGSIQAVGDGFYRYLYMQDRKYIRDDAPIDESCDCICCQRYSRAYLHHLFEIEDYLAYRLATIHNLRFYTRLMKHLQTLDSDRCSVNVQTGD